MRIGYARVSTQDQNLDRQRDQLRQDGCERIYEEKVSGARSDRPELGRLLDALREGDVVVVAELSRLSRSVKDLFSIVGQINERGAEIKSLNIRERTIEGITAARARGRNGGHPPLDSKRVDLALKMYDSKACTVAEITRATGVSKSALYRYLRMKRETNKK